MNIYRMSGIGCQRAIAAEKLGYEPIPETGDSKILLEEATEDEKRVRDRLGKAGIELGSTILAPLVIFEGCCCKQCKEEFGIERFGIHVELTTPLIRLVGHLDDTVVHRGEDYPLGWKDYPLEIKNLGRFTFDKFRRNQFADFPEYEAQEALYLAAKDSSGIYAVRCRDNGRMLTYTVGDGIPDELTEKLRQVEASEFGRLPKPDADKILDKLNWVELNVQDGELPTGEFEEGSNQCRWCKFRFLCLREEKEEKGVKEESSPSLIESGVQYKEGFELEKQGKEMKESAKLALLSHAKNNKIDKFRIAGLVSVSYLGQAIKKYPDEKLLKELVPEDILKKIYKETKPWEDIRVRILKQ